MLSSTYCLIYCCSCIIAWLCFMSMIESYKKWTKWFHNGNFVIVSFWCSNQENLVLIGILWLNSITLEGRPRKFRNHEGIQHSSLFQAWHSSASQLWSKELVRAVTDVFGSSNFECSTNEGMIMTNAIELKHSLTSRPQDIGRGKVFLHRRMDPYEECWSCPNNSHENPCIAEWVKNKRWIFKGFSSFAQFINNVDNISPMVVPYHCNQSKETVIRVFSCLLNGPVLSEIKHEITSLQSGGLGEIKHRWHIYRGR